MLFNFQLSCITTKLHFSPIFPFIHLTQDIPIAFLQHFFLPAVQLKLLLVICVIKSCRIPSAHNLYAYTLLHFHRISISNLTTIFFNNANRYIWYYMEVVVEKYRITLLSDFICHFMSFYSCFRSAFQWWKHSVMWVHLKANVNNDYVSDIFVNQMLFAYGLM